MSVESAKAFIAKLECDAELHMAIERAADATARRHIAKDAGFDFTRDDIRKANAASTNELSDDDLHAIVGGAKATPDTSPLNPSAGGNAAATAAHCG